MVILGEPATGRHGNSFTITTDRQENKRLYPIDIFLMDESLIRGIF